MSAVAQQHDGVSGDSLRDYMVFNRVTRVACARYVSGCSEKEDPDVDVSAWWKISVDTIGALTLLSTGDFFVEVKKHSEKATEALYQTLSLSAKAIENLVKEDMMWPDGEVKLSSNQVLGSVDVAEGCGGHANLEQRFTELVVLSSTHGHRFANELGRRDYVTGEIWKNKPPFSLTLNTASI